MPYIQYNNIHIENIFYVMQFFYAGLKSLWDPIIFISERYMIILNKDT